MGWLGIQNRFGQTWGGEPDVKAIRQYVLNACNKESAASAEDLASLTNYEVDLLQRWFMGQEIDGIPIGYFAGAAAAVTGWNRVRDLPMPSEVKEDVKRQVMAGVVPAWADIGHVTSIDGLEQHWAAYFDGS